MRSDNILMKTKVQMRKNKIKKLNRDKKTKIFQITQKNGTHGKTFSSSFKCKSSKTTHPNNRKGPGSPSQKTAKTAPSNCRKVVG